MVYDIEASIVPPEVALPIFKAQIQAKHLAKETQV